MTTVEVETRFKEFSIKYRALLDEFPEFEYYFTLIHIKDRSSTLIETNECIPCVAEMLDFIIRDEDMKHEMPESLRRAILRIN